MSNPVVGYAGMTHLGLISAVAAAARGFSVVGYDPDSSLTTRIACGDLPVVEPDLPATIAANRERLTFTSDLAVLAGCDILYVAVDVPTDDEGRSDLGPIWRMAERAAAVLGRDALLVILSQVPPGFTRTLSVSASSLFYQVETLIFGRAVERAVQPERFIVGCADPGKPLPDLYSVFLSAFACPILPMRYESAELAKISINFCLVASVSVANTLAEVSEAVGADWAEIVPALKLDRRIGPYSYLNPGLGIAGGNLERDLRTIISIADARHTDVGVVRAWMSNSSHRKDWPWRVLRDVVLSAAPRSRIAVLGLSYKEDTHSTKNSPSLALLRHLEGHDVVVHDPVVSADIVPWADAAADPLAAAAGADVLVIATPWSQYRALEPADLARVMSGRIILDPYRTLDPSACAAAGFHYHALGMAPLRPAGQ